MTTCVRACTYRRVVPRAERGGFPEQARHGLGGLWCGPSFASQARTETEEHTATTLLCRLVVSVAILPLFFLPLHFVMPLFFDNFVIPIFPGSADVFVRAATAATDGPLEARPLCLLLANMMMRAALSRSVASQQAAKTGTTLPPPTPGGEKPLRVGLAAVAGGPEQPRHIRRAGPVTSGAAAPGGRGGTGEGRAPGLRGRCGVVGHGVEARARRPAS
jgi:hypothetical protein